jgi:hypothetical protein
MLNQRSDRGLIEERESHILVGLRLLLLLLLLLGSRGSSSTSSRGSSSSRGSTTTSRHGGELLLALSNHGSDVLALELGEELLDALGLGLDANCTVLQRAALQRVDQRVAAKI